MRFNNKLAVLITVLTFAFVMAGAICKWDSKIADLATGAFLANLTTIVIFYWRKAPSESDPK